MKIPAKSRHFSEILPGRAGMTAVLPGRDPGRALIGLRNMWMISYGRMRIPQGSWIRIYRQKDFICSTLTESIFRSSLSFCLSTTRRLKLLCYEFISLFSSRLAYDKCNTLSSQESCYLPYDTSHSPLRDIQGPQSRCIWYRYHICNYCQLETVEI